MKKIGFIFCFVFYAFLSAAPLFSQEKYDFKELSQNSALIVETVKKDKEIFIQSLFESMNKLSSQFVEPLIKYSGAAMSDMGEANAWAELLEKNRDMFMNNEYMGILVREFEIYGNKESINNLADYFLDFPEQDSLLKSSSLIYAVRLTLNQGYIKKAEKIYNDNEQDFKNIEPHILYKLRAEIFMKTGQHEKALAELDKLIKDYDETWNKIKELEKKSASNARETFFSNKSSQNVNEKVLSSEKKEIDEKQDENKKEQTKILESYVVDAKMMKAKIAFDIKKYNLCIKECESVLKGHKLKLVSAAELKLNSLFELKNYDKLFSDYHELITYFKSFDERIKIFFPYAKALFIKEKYLDLIGEVKTAGSFDEYTGHGPLVSLLLKAAFRADLQPRVLDYYGKFLLSGMKKDSEIVYIESVINRKNRNFRNWYRLLDKLKKMDNFYYEKEAKYFYNARFYYNIHASRWHRAIDMGLKSHNSDSAQKELQSIINFSGAIVGRYEETQKLSKRPEQENYIKAALLIHRNNYSEAIDILKDIKAELTGKNNNFLPSLDRAIKICIFLKSEKSQEEITEFLDRNDFDFFEKIYLVDRFFYKVPDKCRTILNELLKKLSLMKKIQFLDNSELFKIETLIIKPPLASVLLKAASFYLSRPQFSRDALKILKMVLTCEPESAQKAAAWFGMAIEHNKNNNYKLALENIDSALKEQPGKSEYLFFKASLLYENNEFDQARECLEKIAETEITDSEQTKMYYMMGQIMEKKGLIDPAADYYKKAVLIKDSDDLTDMSYHRLANIYFNLNNLQKSEENLEKISDKLNFKYFYSMARIYMERRDRERALEYYSKAVKTSLNPVEEIERDYILCLSESDPEKALSYINKKEEQLVKFNSFEVIKSIVLIRNKKIKEGLDYLNTRISKKSYESDSEYFTLAARAYLEGDEPEKTLSLTKRIKSPKTALFLKSMALIKLSRFKESLEEIEKSSFKTDVLFVLPKAMALTGLGQKSKALEFIKKSNLSEKVKKDYISNIELIKKQ